MEKIKEEEEEEDQKEDSSIRRNRTNKLGQPTHSCLRMDSLLLGNLFVSSILASSFLFSSSMLSQCWSVDVNSFTIELIVSSHLRWAAGAILYRCKMSCSLLLLFLLLLFVITSFVHLSSIYGNGYRVYLVFRRYSVFNLQCFGKNSSVDEYQFALFTLFCSCKYHLIAMIHQCVSIQKEEANKECVCCFNATGGS